MNNIWRKILFIWWEFLNRIFTGFFLMKKKMSINTWAFYIYFRLISTTVTQTRKIRIVNVTIELSFLLQLITFVTDSMYQMSVYRLKNGHAAEWSSTSPSPTWNSPEIKGLVKSCIRPRFGIENTSPTVNKLSPRETPHNTTRKVSARMCVRACPQFHKRLA